MTTTIDESGNPQQWTAVYWRYHSRYEEVCDSFREAYRYLENGEEYGELSSESILGPDGRELMDQAAIHRAQIDQLDPDALLRVLSNREIEPAQHGSRP